MSNARNIIVIGTSAGGLAAIKSALAGLPANLDATIVAVIHMSRNSKPEVIVSVVERNTSLKCELATDGAPLEPGRFYMAQADRHVMISDGRIRLNQGPHENKYRPSIDVLFRSAAVNYGNRVIGIVLTGLLDDGTSGMWAIKQCGGLAIVQDPAEALFPDMPQSVLNKVGADHVTTLQEMPAMITDLLQSPLPAQKPVPEEIRLEATITEKMMSNIDDLKKLGEKSDFVCPDCGGGLYEMNNDPAHRYRCHTGHVYTEKLLDVLKDEKIEESLWVSIRMLEEKQNLLQLMEQRSDRPSTGHRSRIANVEEHIGRLKGLLVKFSEKG